MELVQSEITKPSLQSAHTLTHRVETHVSGYVYVAHTGLLFRMSDMLIYAHFICHYFIFFSYYPHTGRI